MPAGVVQADSNVEVVRRAFENFRAGDAEALVDLLDPEVALYPHSGRPYRGHHGWREYVAGQLKRGSGLEADVSDFLAHDDGVIAFGHLRTSGSGETSETAVAWLFRVRNGKIVCGEVYAGESREDGRSSPSPRVLSERERQILNLLAIGLTGAEVAARIHLSPETVRTHVKNARSKLAAKTRVEAVAKALILGEIDCREPGC